MEGCFHGELLDRISWRTITSRELLVPFRVGPDALPVFATYVPTEELSKTWQTSTQCDSAGNSHFFSFELLLTLPCRRTNEVMLKIRLRERRGGQTQ